MIISLFGAIPYIGDDLVLWIRGDYVVADATLNRFFAFHVIMLPLILLALVVFHLIALHSVGSNNPDGIEIKKKKNDKGIPVDGVPFHPYYTIKDSAGAIAFLIIFAYVIFYAPEMGGWFLEKDNFIPSDPLKTPENIVPLWYFTPFYAILRAVPDKFLGVMCMGASIFVLFILPWLDRSPVKSIRYKGPIFKIALGTFIVSFIALGYLGTVAATPVATIFSRIFTILYFAFFLLMPYYSRIDKVKPEPEQVK